MASILLYQETDLKLCRARRRIPMKPDETLDLCGVVDPYCLILCKATMASMRQGGTIEICIRDPDTMKDLLTILQRSGEVLIRSEKCGDRFHLLVRKCSA